MELNKVKIGEYLQALRKAKGRSQQEIADYFNVSNKTVSKWETGLSIPDTALLFGLAEYYEVTIDDILKGGRAYKQESIIDDHKKSEERWKGFEQQKLTLYNLFLFSGYVLQLLGYILGLAIGYASSNGYVAGGIILGFSMISIALVIGYNIYFLGNNRELKDKIRKSFRIRLIDFGFLSIFVFTCGLVYLVSTASSMFTPAIIVFTNAFIYMVIFFSILLVIRFIFVPSKVRNIVFKAINKYKIMYFLGLLLMLICFIIWPCYNVDGYNPYRFGYSTLLGSFTFNNEPSNIFIFIVMMALFISMITIMIIIIFKKKKPLVFYFISLAIIVLNYYLYTVLVDFQRGSIPLDSNRQLSTNTNGIIVIVPIVMVIISFLLELPFAKIKENNNMES